MPRVYLAGPMRGYPQFNFPAFDKAASLGRALKWEVISPADMDREHGFDERVHHDFTPGERREFIRRDVEAIMSLRAEDGDAIAMLPNWEKSGGARAEYALAKWARLKILDALTFERLVH